MRKRDACAVRRGGDAWSVACCSWCVPGHEARNGGERARASRRMRCSRKYRHIQALRNAEKACVGETESELEWRSPRVTVIKVGLGGRNTAKLLMQRLRGERAHLRTRLCAVGLTSRVRSLEPLFMRNSRAAAIHRNRSRLSTPNDHVSTVTCGALCWQEADAATWWQFHSPRRTSLVVRLSPT